MQLRDVLLVLHIAGAAAWLGANILQGYVPVLAARQGTEAVAGWYRVTGELSKKFYMPASILVLATGIWMVLIDDSIAFEDPFIAIGIGMVVVGALLGILVYSPGSEDAAVAIESRDENAVAKTTGKLARFGALETILLLITIAVMVTRLQ